MQEFLSGTETPEYVRHPLAANFAVVDAEAWHRWIITGDG